MSGITFYIIDAFATKAFEGNPAGVCILPAGHGLGDEWMQKVAAEINLSETAFVEPDKQSLRWFTPAAEVDLCGHATVATAAALCDAGKASVGDVLRFDTRSGWLSAKLEGENRVSLDFPSTPPAELTAEEELKSLFDQADFFGKSRFDLIVELPNEQAVQNFDPDFQKMKRLSYRGIIVTAQSDRDDLDFVSRFFAPAVGVDEDPVTGSAHCCLTPYWANKLGKSTLSARQLSQRGGYVDVELKGERVILRGGAIKVVKGTLF